MSLIHFTIQYSFVMADFPHNPSNDSNYNPFYNSYYLLYSY